MYPADLRARLRAALDPAPSPVPEPGDRLAAVLALLVEEPELALVFGRRSDALPRHAGQVAFPGGVADEGDLHLAATALREAEEEVGLDPALPEVLGALPPVHTTVSGILVVPFNAGGSYLMRRIDGTQGIGSRMPLGGAPLDSIDAENLRRWIAQGARRN